MQAGRSRRIGTGCAALAATALCLGATSAPVLADHPLEPDLVTLPLSDLSVVQKPNKTHLLLQNEVGNQGTGPLEIFSEPAPPQGCGPQGTPFEAVQRVYVDTNDNDEFDRGPDQGDNTSPIGCLKYHDKPGHDHWHVLDFAKYSLISEDDGSIKDGRKAGFCLLDITTPFPDIAGPRFYGSASCSFSDPTTPPEIEGISVGWSDIYGSSTVGQFVDVTGLERGRYCLRSRADPLNQITESSNSNNTNEVRVRLNPNQLRVRRLAGACEIPR